MYIANWAFKSNDLPKFPSETNSLRVLVITWNMFGKVKYFKYN